MISARELVPKRLRSLKREGSGWDGEGAWLISRTHRERAKFHLKNRGSRFSCGGGTGLPAGSRENASGATF